MSTATIERLTLQRSCMPLRAQFVTALRATNVVETVRVNLIASDDTSGSGEATPITVVTGETLDSVESALSARIGPAVVGLDADDLDAALAAVAHVAAERDPSAVAAVDLALHDLCARRRGITVRKLLLDRAGWASGPADSICTDMTLSAATPAQMAAAATAAVAAGFGVLKLKLGDRHADDVERVKAVAAAIRPEVKLRIDANQGWDVTETLRVMQAVAQAGIAIDLLEQPVLAEDLEGLAEINAQVGCTVMADEAVWSARDVEAVAEREAATLVNVKLMKCGGLQAALETVAAARDCGLGWVVGCMMEGALGVSAAASLASLAPPSTTHDLDAGWWQSPPPLTYESGRLLLPEYSGLGILV